MAAAERLKLCLSEALRDGEAGLRFEVERDGSPCAAFAIRHRGIAYAYVNRCAHIGVELDWRPGQFFNHDASLLICATHGALYEPQSGKCIEGPCRGQSLTRVALEEKDGFIYCSE